jgi:hypothetical protein
MQESTSSAETGKASHSVGGRRYFTLEEAEALISVLQPRLRLLQRTAREVLERRKQIELLLRNGSSHSGVCSLKSYQEELQSAARHLEVQWQRISQEVASLRQLGVVVRSVASGIIDFPSLYHGQQIYLCWNIDEPTILYWHPAEGGFHCRRLLDSLFEADWTEKSARKAPAVVR